MRGEIRAALRGEQPDGFDGLAAVKARVNGQADPTDAAFAAAGH